VRRDEHRDEHREGDEHVHVGRPREEDFRRFRLVYARFVWVMVCTEGFVGVRHLGNEGD